MLKKSVAVERTTTGAEAHTDSMAYAALKGGSSTVVRTFWIFNKL
jgi:hypothetical protein